MRMNPHRLTNPNTVASHRLVTMVAASIDAFEDKYNEFMECLRLFFFGWPVGLAKQGRATDKHEIPTDTQKYQTGNKMHKVSSGQCECDVYT